MNDNPEERAPLSADETAFVNRIAEQYVPAPLAPARRAALDAELRERLAEPSRSSFLQPALASVVVALAVGFVWLLGALEPETPREVRIRTAVAEWRAAETWERELLDPQSFDAEDGSEDLDELPDDYAAIAGLFLDG